MLHMYNDERKYKDGFNINMNTKRFLYFGTNLVYCCNNDNNAVGLLLLFPGRRLANYTRRTPGVVGVEADWAT